MSAQALATVIGPPLMLHSPNSNAGSEVDHAQPIAVLKYLLQIWPQPQTSNVSGNVIPFFITLKTLVFWDYLLFVTVEVAMIIITSEQIIHLICWLVHI